MNILALIPARSGSKSIPDKNIRLLLGKPLIAYSIEHALKSRYINRVILSTDSEEYAVIGRKYGAETPFLRPPEISGDRSLDIEFFIHALDWLKEHENYEPDFCVHLRPTHPLRNISDTERMIGMLIKDPDADSIRSLVRNKSIIPYKMWLMNEANEITPLLQIEGVKEPYNSPRQTLPVTYFQNASVDVIRTESIVNKRSLSGDKILGYIMEEDCDIDYEEDFIKVERKLISERLAGCEVEDKIICFDIDGVIASLVPGNDYSLASPEMKVVQLIQKLYEKGNRVILFTARGTVTGIDWKEVTERQLKEWGVPYHELHFGKPGADFFIDDRAINISELITKL